MKTIKEKFEKTIHNKNIVYEEKEMLDIIIEIHQKDNIILK